MNLLDPLVHTALYLYILNPLYLLSNYIENLEITSDPDTYLTPTQSIRRHGYPAESHIVQTNDGFLLDLHRIPFSTKNKMNGTGYPVLLIHGGLSSSYQWIMKGVNESLGYILADEGYDVWLHNMRGNTYSRSHIDYTPKQKEFWDHSVHEMGIYDLPAAIDYILEITGQDDLIVVGHSIGTTIFYIMASILPQYDDKIKAHISLAPITAIPHCRSFIRFFNTYQSLIYNFLKEHTSGALLEHDLETKIILQILESVKLPLSPYSLFDIMKDFNNGFDPQQIDNKFLHAFTSHFFDGYSVKTAIHDWQFGYPGIFAQFDYGLAENIKRYGTPQPPPYNLSNVNIPVRIYYGENDPMGNPTDSKILYKKLPKGAGLVRVNDSLFTHDDFFMGKDLNQLVNNNLVQFIHNTTNN